ncbi:hypothetical protein V6N13_021646 [Hibiscus sabdariffa]
MVRPQFSRSYQHTLAKTKKKVSKAADITYQNYCYFGSSLSAGKVYMFVSRYGSNMDVEHEHVKITQHQILLHSATPKPCSLAVLTAYEAFV